MYKVGSSEIRVGGHRGYGETDAPQLRDKFFHSYPPAENTIESIEMALDHDVDLIEIDIVLSKDGVPMVTHSNDLREHVLDGTITDEKCFVSQFTAKELQAMKVGPVAGGVHYMPTLEQVLERVKAHNASLEEEKRCLLNIEFKDTRGTNDVRETSRPRLVDAVAKIIHKTQMPKEDIILSSFAASLLMEAKEKMPDIKRGMLFTRANDPLLGQRLFTKGDDDNSRYYSFKPEVVKQLHEQIGLSALHPEISTLVEPEKLNGTQSNASKILDALGVELKSPSGEKLVLNCWALNEAKKSSDRSFQIFNAIDRVAAHGLKLGLITNFVTRTQELVDGVYTYLPLLDEGECREAPAGYYDRFPLSMDDIALSNGLAK